MEEKLVIMKFPGNIWKERGTQVVSLGLEMSLFAIMIFCVGKTENPLQWLRTNQALIIDFSCRSPSPKSPCVVSLSALGNIS